MVKLVTLVQDKELAEMQ